MLTIDCIYGQVQEVVPCIFASALASKRLRHINVSHFYLPKVVGQTRRNIFAMAPLDVEYQRL